MQDYLQTMALSFQEICQGEEPWIALGNFMHAWYGDAKNHRSELIQEPLTLPPKMTTRQKKWAVFIAASVEWFCAKYELICPAWALDPSYTLKKPWFWIYTRAANNEKTRLRLLTETPEPFKRRNIYCGNRMYLNKYELTDMTAQIVALKARLNQASHHDGG
jgi:hypothetical protein